ncbi:Velvet complex subunit 1 [Hyphodiscus hymeniophilus]|uniref:Velvet complex subunit 1 n=1 Tax=Hyphodiscus hymeniophilus TaxID=353542 RepID=A0A9P6VHZ8_9HELO|nr:Velvet complex subunit 1 [Hyphodiscus hymeniophilus]
MASTAPPRHVRQKPMNQDRPPQMIERNTVQGRRLRYELKVIQQPERARACGSGAKSSADRRPVDPPPVVELKIFEVVGRDPKQDPDITFAYNANFFLFATLELARPMAHGRVPPPQAAQVPVLTGMPVSGMAYLDRPSEAGYFIFPDLSVRHEGKYRLSFNLYEETKEPDEDADKDPAVESNLNIHAGQQDPEASFDWRMELKSDVFDVFSAKKFPGLAESTPSSRTVAEQGCRVRIRRDVRMRRRGDGKGNGDFDEEEVYERQSRAPTVDDFERERSRSSSNGSEGHRQPFDQQGHLGFGLQQQSQFVAPQPTFQTPQFSAQGYRQQAQQYGHAAPPPPPQAQHYGYDRTYPQSAHPVYPSNPPREMHEDPYRRASMAGHPNEQFPHHYPGQEQNFNRFQPYHAQLPQSPAQGLPPLLHLSGKFENSPPAQLPPVRSIAPALHSPTYERRESGFYSQPGAPLAPALLPEPPRDLEPVRIGKRSFDTAYPSAASREPLYNGMRPGTPYEDEDEDETSIMNELRMSYKRADGSNQARALPQLG